MKTAGLALGLALLAALPAEPSPQDAKVVYIGEVSQDALKKLKFYRPLTAYLDAHLGPKGWKFKTMMPKDLTQAADFLQSGRLDIFIDSLMPVYYVSSVLESRGRATGKADAGLQITCKRWKKGVREYSSVIISRKKDGPSRLEDLKGKIVGFEDPWSTSGYFLPRAALHEVGLSVQRLESPRDPVPADKVGYLFFEGAEKSIPFLDAGKASAVGVEQAVWDQLGEAGQAEYQLLYKSAPVPRHLLSFRKGLDPALVEAVTQALVAAENSDDGKGFLKEFEATTRFEAVGAEEESKLRTLAFGILKKTELLSDR